MIRPVLNITHHKLHEKAMRGLVSRLRKLRHECQIMPETGRKFDLLVDRRIRCEVKAAQPREDPGGWFFNLHRHGKRSTGEVDLFALFLLPSRIWLIIPAPEIDTRHTVFISMRTLSKWIQWQGRWELFNKSHFPAIDDLSLELFRNRKDTQILVRMARLERRLFAQAAKAKGMKIPAWLRSLGHRESARQGQEQR